MDNSSSSGSESVSGAGEWLDVESDMGEQVTIVSLLDGTTFPDAASMLEDCKRRHGFDFIATCRTLALDFHNSVKLINFVRQCGRDGRALPPSISLEDFQDDKYLKPVIEDDALIFCLDELVEEPGEATSSPPSGQAPLQLAGNALQVRNAVLEEELERVKTKFANYRLAVEETLDQRWGEDKPNAAAASLPANGETKGQDSDGYFEAYSYNDIHETMLKDTVRTDAYRDFIYQNKDLFRGKAVLDVGCGTGILSMFCAKAGAKHVYAVDRSDIIDKARENVFRNGLSDIVTCIRGMVEDISLPVSKVDIIVSEWMGYCLLYEAMLQSVLVARDRFLKPDGLLVPSFTTLWLAPLADPDYILDQVAFWSDIYGFDMQAMQAGIYDEARIEVMAETTICGSARPFLQLPLHSVTTEELTFRSSWTTTLSRDIDSLDGFLVWFDTYFTRSRDEPVPVEESAEAWAEKKTNRVAFTTGPFRQATHWKQGLLLVDHKGKPSALRKQTEIKGEISYSVVKDNKRGVSIGVSWSPSVGAGGEQSWKLR